MLDNRSLPVQRCLACGKSAEIPVGLECPWCGVEGAWESVLHQGPSDAMPRSLDLPASLAESSGLDPRRVPSGDPELDKLLGGGWFVGESVLVKGPQGSGKSRLTLRWASQLDPALVVSLEMTAALVREAAEGSRANLAALYPVHQLSGWQAVARRLGARCVIIDSVSKSRTRVFTVLEGSDWARRTGHVAFLISHENRCGNASGSTALEHEPDTVIRVHNASWGWATVSVEKRRASPQGSVRLWVSGDHEPGNRPPRGSGPRLRLVR